MGSFTMLLVLLEHRARKMSRMDGRGAPMIFAAVFTVRWRVLRSALHLHLVIWQTLLSKATYNWGIHKAIHLEEAIRQRKCS